MRARTVVFAISAALLGLTGGSIIQASAFDEETYVTFSESVAIPGATLRPGTYIFERVTSDNSLVRVMSRDRRHVYLTQFTRSVDRPSSVSGDAAVTLDEARRGEPQQVKAWFPADAASGQEFVYR